MQIFLAEKGATGGGGDFLEQRLIHGGFTKLEFWLGDVEVQKDSRILLHPKLVIARRRRDKFSPIQTWLLRNGAQSDLGPGSLAVFQAVKAFQALLLHWLEAHSIKARVNGDSVPRQIILA